MMLSRHRHALLVNGLEQQAAPLGASAHFQLYPLTATPLADEFIIIHEFSASQIDNNLGYYVVSELLPLLAAHRRRVDSGYSEQDEFERSVGDIVRSMAGNERRAWRLFYANTLNATQNSAGLGQPPGRSDEAASDFISLFGAIYRYALELIEALPAAASPPTVLDAATCFGFFPLLLARVRAATLGEIAGNRIHGNFVQSSGNVHLDEASAVSFHHNLVVSNRSAGSAAGLRIGREGGKYSIEFFTEQKTVCLQL